MRRTGDYLKSMEAIGSVWSVWSVWSGWGENLKLVQFNRSVSPHTLLAKRIFYPWQVSTRAKLIERTKQARRLFYGEIKNHFM
ncbi:MAG: hypothetical protein SXA11_12375 [Cyanobacteriota bacterium]|nr:hypothetical protein [Cyanobacteriota bacterium]